LAGIPVGWPNLFLRNAPENTFVAPHEIEMAFDAPHQIKALS
jgi:hypothetical protein